MGREFALLLDKIGDVDLIGASTDVAASPLPPNPLPVRGDIPSGVVSRGVIIFSAPLLGLGDAEEVTGGGGGGVFVFGVLGICDLATNAASMTSTASFSGGGGG